MYDPTGFRIDAAAGKRMNDRISETDFSRLRAWRGFDDMAFVVFRSTHERRAIPSQMSQLVTMA